MLNAKKLEKFKVTTSHLLTQTVATKVSKECDFEVNIFRIALLFYSAQKEGIKKYKES